MTMMEALSATVNHLMKELNLSETDVSTRCGLSLSTVRRIISGTGKYSTPATALKLMQGIGVPQGLFYGLVETYRAQP